MTKFNIKKFYLSPIQRIFCFLRISEQTATSAKYSINYWSL